MTWHWLLYGVGVGLLIWLSQRISVKQLSPERAQAGRRRVITGAVLRWLLSAVLLALALEQGIGSGLAAFGGLMSARWLGIFSLNLFPLPEDDRWMRRT